MPLVRFSDDAGSKEKPSSDRQGGGHYSASYVERVISSGIPTLDYFDGGGYLLGRLVLLIDRNFTSTDLGDDFLRSFLKAGLSDGDRIVVIGKEPNRLLPDVSLLQEDGSDGNETATTAQIGAGEEDGGVLRIAWRYAHLPTATVISSSQDNPVRNAAVSKDSSKIFTLASCEHSLADVFSTLNSCLKSQAGGDEIVRIVIDDFALLNFTNNMASLHASDLLRFIYRLRALISKSSSTVIIRTAQRAISVSNILAETFLARLAHASDYVFSIVSFNQLDESAGPNDAIFTKEHVGMLQFEKVPFVSDMFPPLFIEDRKYALKRKRTRVQRQKEIVLERMHLPPDIAENTSRVSSSGCSGAASGTDAAHESW